MVRASSRAVSAARVAVAVLLALMLSPAVAHAWTPGTHIFLGEAIMRSLALLPGRATNGLSRVRSGSRRASACWEEGLDLKSRRPSGL